MGEGLYVPGTKKAEKIRMINWNNKIRIYAKLFSKLVE